MGKRVRALLVVAGLSLVLGACAEGQPPLEPAAESQFAPGQVWRYETRPGEEASRVFVGKVEQSSALGVVVHVKLVGLKVASPSAPGGVFEVMSHAPIAEAQLSESVTELTRENADLDGFAEGYETWRAAYESGESGVFTIPLSAIAEYMEQALGG